MDKKAESNALPDFFLSRCKLLRHLLSNTFICNDVRT